MPSTLELACKYGRKFKPTLFDTGIGARLPAAYRKFYDEWRNTVPEPVHYVPFEGGIWFLNKDCEVKRRENVPLPTHFPKELHSVFTGGEAVVQGFIFKKYVGRIPRFWVPKVFRSVLYSEILDKYLSALMTKRAVELIHKHMGLDTYLLQTRACDLFSLVSLKLKRKLLLTLSKNDLPYGPEKNKEIFQKYEKFLLPPEEIEWYGLSFNEACHKLKEMEEAEIQTSIIPLKHVYRAKLIEELKERTHMQRQPLKEENLDKAGKWVRKLTEFHKSKKS